MRRGMLVVGLVLMAIGAFPQPAEQPKNALKLELVGPFIMFRTGFAGIFQWKRFALRYERRLEEVKFLSAVGELEYRQRLEHFHISHSDHGFTYQREVSLVLGGRIFAPIIDGNAFHLLFFAEPRAAFTWRHARLDHYDSLVTFTHTDFDDDPGIVPRLRAGIGFGFGRVVGLEISGDLARHKILGDNRHQWEIFPELSLVFRF